MRRFTIVHCVLYLSSKPVNPMWLNAHINTHNIYSTHFEDTAGGKIKLIKATNPAMTVREREQMSEGSSGASPKTVQSHSQDLGP